MRSVPDLAESLAAVYGDDRSRLQSQYDRYLSAMACFITLAGPGPLAIFRAPGRVNLIGEHTDYNHGFVLPMALDKDTLLLARRRSDRLVRLWNIEDDLFTERSFTISADIPAGPVGDWGNDVKAAAQAFFQSTQGKITGMDALVAGSAPWGIPRAAGLSSSSALVVVSALAIASLNGVALHKEEFARLCSEAEWYVGTRGGIMDHFISILAQRGFALRLDCRPVMDGGHAHYRTLPVRIPDGYRVLICNSGVPRQKTRSQYNVRVAECRLAVAMLKRQYPQITHLRDVADDALHLSREQVGVLLDGLPEHLTIAQVYSQPDLAATMTALNTPFASDQVFKVRARARHVVSENERVLAAVDALQAGDAERFGRLMNAAHYSMSRDYDASSPEVDILADIARHTPGVLGARVTGAGWGGCIVALAEDSDRGIEDTIAEQYHVVTGLTSDIFVCRSAPGANLVYRGIHN